MQYKTLCLLACAAQLAAAFNHDRKSPTSNEVKEAQTHQKLGWENTNIKHLLRLKRSSADEDAAQDLIDAIFEEPDLTKKQDKRQAQAWSIPMPDIPKSVATFVQNTFVPNGNQFNYYLNHLNPLYAPAMLHFPIFVPILYCIWPPRNKNSTVDIDNRFLFPDDPQIAGGGGQGPTTQRPQTQRPQTQRPQTQRPQTQRPIPQPIPQPLPPVEPEEESLTGISLTPARPSRPNSVTAPPLEHGRGTTTSQRPPYNAQPEESAVEAEIGQIFGSPTRPPPSNLRPLRPQQQETTQRPQNNNVCENAIRYCCASLAPGPRRTGCFTQYGCPGPIWGDPCEGLGN